MAMNNHYLIHGYFATAIAFNVASFHSIYYEGGPLFTRHDPMADCVAMITLWALYATFSFRLIAIANVILSVIIGWMVVTLHLPTNKYIEFDDQQQQQQEGAYHSTNWKFAVTIHVIGSMLLMRQALQGRCYNRESATLLSILLLFTLLLTGDYYFFSKTSNDNKVDPTMCSDVPFFKWSKHKNIKKKHFRPFYYQSHFVTMSDGVELAVDVFLPNKYKNMNNSHHTEPPLPPLPTFLHMTRYHRAELRSWWTHFFYLFGHAPNPQGIFPMRSLRYLNLFVPNGYAFVSVDVRGTGASFGNRPLDLIQREVQDLGEIAEWTHKQPFCNGRIGTGGISYDGITGALLAAATSGVNIDAAALLFAPGDIYEDIAFVGGVPTIGFIDTYSLFTTASENNLPVEDVDNELPTSFKLISNLAFRGVAPVYGAEDRLMDAIAEHKKNFDMETKARDPTIVAKDSTLVYTPDDSRHHTALDMGITEETYRGLINNNVAVYSVAGYYDSGSVRSAARLHNYMVEHGGYSKLTIGPWTHGCRKAWTPTKSVNATTPQYLLFEDVLRFFDCHLKDQCETLLPDEPPVHYFLSGQDQWHTTYGLWPPSFTSNNSSEILQEKVISLNQMMNVAENGNDNNIIISSSSSSPDDKIVSYLVDFTATTGVASRWNLVQHLMKKSVTYPDRKQQTQNALVLQTSPLEASLSIVGSPTIQLSIALVNATDAVVFAYLEEYNPVDDDTLNYITETTLRLSHRQQASTSTSGSSSSSDHQNTHHYRVGAFDNIQRSFLKEDMKPLEPNVFTTVDLVLEPLAYMIPAGHILRLAFAGSDVDNFFLDNIPNLAREWKIDLGASILTLPILVE